MLLYLLEYTKIALSDFFQNIYLWFICYIISYAPHPVFRIVDVVPDRSYSTLYQEVINYVKTNGQFDVATMGNVSNVGLMARKAEEYGSHDKTFEVEAGRVVVTDNNSDEVYFEHVVGDGDIWRMCQTKDEPIREYVL